jgi:uncharacterized protein
MRARLVPTLLALLLTAGLAATPAAGSLRTSAGAVSQTSAAAAPRDDADHSEHYFPSSDGITMLHADVLRPKGMPDDVRTPVVLTVSPYTNHNGSTIDLDPLGEGPNPRFYDFLDLTGALERGYTYVMVDLPGTGGSGGCNDWGGVREQGAVRAAVEWAASQPWSNGRVALLGKSYDAWTGLMGVAQQPEGLAAVVAMEPVYSGYRYLYMNGVRRPNVAGTPAIFQVVDAKPGRVNDDPIYHVNGAPQVWCYPLNVGGALVDDSPTGVYWAERDLGPTAAGKQTPVFLMQGFLETNTKVDGAFAYYNALAGEHNRAWFGQFDHVRGWEMNTPGSVPGGDGTREQTGRAVDVFIDELMRFLDLHLLGVEPEVADPTVAVQDVLGRYRAEDQWPPADAHLYTTALRTGTYTDSGSGSGLRPTATQGVWTVSEPLPHDVWLSGEPYLVVGADSVPNANLAANVYDISPDGEARMISRGVALLRGLGTKTASFPMYGQDWPIPAGHRIGVLLSSANTEEFIHVPTQSTVTLRSARIALPFLTYDRAEFLDGGSTPRLENYLGAPATVLPEALLADREHAFTLPPPLRPADTRP